MKGFLETYLECSKEHGFRPDSLHEVVRYLLVNGHINFTEENLALMGDREFFLGADKVPKEFHEKLIELAKGTDRKDWTIDDDFEREEKKLLDTELEGIRIKAGRVAGVKIGLSRMVEVYQTYDVHNVDGALFD